MDCHRFRRCLVLFAGALFFTTAAVDAHVRWFVQDGDEHAGLQHNLDGTNKVVLIGVALYVILAVVVHRFSMSWKGPRRVVEWIHGIFEGKSLEWRTVAILTGIMVFANAASGFFLAPNLEFRTPGLTLWGRVAQVIVGILLISHLSYVTAGVLIIGAVLHGATYFPMGLLVDYLCEFISLAVALILLGPRLNPLDKRLVRLMELSPENYDHLALPIIRVGTGLTLVILAFHNKLLNPGLCVSFLDEYPLNFMPLLGFAEFTNLHFVFAAGVVELMFGLLLVAGIATRFTTGTLAIFFVATLITVGPVELVGHAPLFGIVLLFIVLLFIVQGSGPLALLKSMEIRAEPSGDSE